MQRWAQVVIGLAVAAPLADCSGGNQALVASGGRQDFAAMQHVTEEFGDAEPDAVVPVMVGDQRNDYRVWIHKTKPKIMVQTAALGNVATAGFVRGLTLGAVSGDLDFEPVQRAAIDYLTSTRGPGCTLANSRKIARVGWEWDYDCPKDSPPKRR